MHSATSMRILLRLWYTASAFLFILFAKSCIEKLKPSSRQLLEIAYDSETAIKDFAKKMNKKADAVYQSLRRIRILVAECMEQKIYKT